MYLWLREIKIKKSTRKVDRTDHEKGNALS